MSCRFLLLLLAVVIATPAIAGELIRYRRPDGTVGFTGSTSDVPPGARILTRQKTSTSANPGEGSSPSLGQLLSGVGRHCEALHRRDTADFEQCIAAQTRAAFELRDLLLVQPAGSEAERLSERCRRRVDRRRPNYRKLVDCIEHAQNDFETRAGSHPASLDVERESTSAEQERNRKHAAQQERLERLRSDQARAAREMEIGRELWGPRYREAEKKLREAEARRQGVVDRMRRRGCRTDTLACGSLGPQLEAARREEAKRRDYLTDDLVNECRRAGCQPGWLR
jgi:hypothetical protein